MPNGRGNPNAQVISASGNKTRSPGLRRVINDISTVMWLVCNFDS